MAKRSKVPKLTAKFAFMDREVTDEDTKEVIDGWKSLQNKLYQEEVNALVQKHYKLNLKFQDLLDLIKYINSYLETKEFGEWFDNEYMLAEGAQGAIMLQHGAVSSDSIDVTSCNSPNFERDQERDLKKIAKIMGDSMDDAESLLRLIGDEPFDERKKFGKLGQYLEESFPAPLFQVHLRWKTCSERACLLERR